MLVLNLVKLAATLFLEIWLLILLTRRNIRRLFPFFFIYIVLVVPSTAARLAASFHYPTYFYIYWFTEALLLLLSLAALHEVFHWMFEGFYRLWWFQVFYYGTIVVVLTVAVRNAFVSPPVQSHPVISLILDVSIAVNFVRAGIAALFIVLHGLLVVEFRRYAYGIVLGFGISSGGSLIGYLLFSVFGTKLESFTRNLSAVAYIVGLLIWVASFIRPEPEDQEYRPPLDPDQMLEEVQGYLRALGIAKIKK